MEKWMLKNIKFNYDKMSKYLDVSNIITRILVNRGITEEDIAYRYVNPSIDYLYNPKLMRDLEKGVKIIKESIEKQQNILIVGDYDVDGVTSTYVLYTSLLKCGAKVSYYIPDRISEGYGINENIILQAKERGFEVIITCDNGIAAIEQIKLAKELGLTVVITDHHDIAFVEENENRRYVVPEADAVLNPKQLDCPYPFKLLCGAGVVLKFVTVLFEHMNINKTELQDCLQFAAIATVCDVVDLVDENRIIVKNGLKIINNTENIGLKALIEVTGLENKQITVYSLGFVIGPCINATGRLEHATIALKLFLSKDYIEAKELAEKLFGLNRERQDMTTAGVEEAINIIENSSLKGHKVLVVYMPEIHESIAGIIAGRIRERYNLPTFVLTKGEEGVKGSGRSIEGYNMFEELIKCKELLDKFGGHPMAAGLSIKENNIEPLREKLNEVCTLGLEDLVPKVYIDIHLPVENVSLDLAEELDMLQPFGKGNSKPIFAERGIKVVKATILGANKNVLKFKMVSPKGKAFEAIYFGDINKFNETIEEELGKEEALRIYESLPNKVFLDLIYNISINEYKGVKSPQIVICNYRISKK